MKKYIVFIASVVVFIASVGFAFQEPVQDESKAQKPIEAKESSRPDDILKELEKTRKELEKERLKNDSVNNERQYNVDLLKKSVTDLQFANKSYRKSLNKLIYVVGKFNPDSVMRYYGEYPDTTTETPQDTVKKKIETIAIDAPVKKMSLIKRIFTRKR